MHPNPELVEAARQGDVEALGELLVRCHPDARRFARSLCPTPEDAEDAVQETLWIISRRIGSLRMAVAFTTWLFRLVKHECLRLLRSQRRKPVVHAALAPILETEREAIQAALLGDIAKAIAALPLGYRQVLVMRDIEGLTSPEVARSLDLSAPAVKSRLHRARGMVRASLLNWLD
ncbi:MAG: RNA polymerase sigma factor [Candidatus Dormibacteraceae bacterium]